ncbi:MAG: hypothetical protein B6I24_11295 [Bacteroidetes bacterium 4572_128]|nr:MAG: hypothetical protein B6I24_11295 [Bacteroidetes bacterium 4572_128]
MKNIIQIILLFLLSVNCVFAQADKEKTYTKQIDITELFLLALTTTDTILVFDNYDITNKLSGDLSVDDYLKEKHSDIIKLDTADRIIVKPGIKIKNSKLNSVFIEGICFQKFLEILDCRLNGDPNYGDFQLLNCYLKLLKLNHTKGDYSTFLYGCDIKNIDSSDYTCSILWVLYCNFDHMRFKELNCSTRMLIEGCNFYLPIYDDYYKKLKFDENFEIEPYNREIFVSTVYISGMNSKINNLKITKCTFHSGDKVGVYKRMIKMLVTMSEFELIDNVFELPLNLCGSIIKTNATITGNTFNDYIGLAGMVIPANLKSNWQQFDGYKLASMNKVRIWESLAGKTIRTLGSSNLYLGKNKKELADNERFYDLISSYQSLFNRFKARGDVESANACYVEMKDVYMRKLEYMYQQNKTFRNFFAWQLATLLKVYTKHGTDPARAIVMSMYIILFFGIFYFFFPSDWNIFNKNAFLSRFEKLVSYFENDTRLHNLESDSEIRKTLQDFKQLMAEKRENIPSVVYLLSKPLFKVDLFVQKLYVKIINMFDLVPRKYTELSKKRRILVNIMYGSAIVFVLCFLFFVRLLNAITLSVNVFTTLGFGNIPTKGFARYVAIFQGFIGWFLLSLFSVALINQVLF